ncbi:hypothetical protein EVAR_67232_1 [Eumeta japonica]|uniref:Uncharacterized protein n=1 Tax=Eumeta variegata TaxID=151549 RepID=A0A4C1YQQ5_EUMVA|nr:hypothetical protein EVAR_67232_1 [Eumeta japonica]
MYLHALAGDLLPDLHFVAVEPQKNICGCCQDNLTPEPNDMNDDDNYSSKFCDIRNFPSRRDARYMTNACPRERRREVENDVASLELSQPGARASSFVVTNGENSSRDGFVKRYHVLLAARNGEVSESGGGSDSMAELWASYHSALGLGSKPPKAPTPLTTGPTSPMHPSSATPSAEPASTHDETSSSDRAKDDDDGAASDDDSDDRVDAAHHDPERLKAFNVSTHTRPPSTLTLHSNSTSHDCHLKCDLK